MNLNMPEGDQGKVENSTLPASQTQPQPSVTPEANLSAIADENYRPAAPSRVEDYSLQENIPTHAIQAEDRPHIDAFTVAAHEAGLNQNEYAFAVSWALNTPPEKMNAEAFMDAAISAGWRNREIVETLNFVRTQFGGGQKSSAASQSGKDYARLSEIKNIMRNDSSRYYGDPALQAEALELYRKRIG